jgi:hypothetical protein
LSNSFVNVLLKYEKTSMATSSVLLSSSKYRSPKIANFRASLSPSIKLSPLLKPLISSSPIFPSNSGAKPSLLITIFFSFSKYVIVLSMAFAIGSLSLVHIIRPAEYNIAAIRLSAIPDISRRHFLKYLFEKKIS